MRCRLERVSVLPDTDPVIDQTAPETPLTEAPTIEESILDELRASTREAWSDSLYDHLPCTKIECDWAMKGLHVCLIIGMKCYGFEFHSEVHLTRHLHNRAHLRHEVTLTVVHFLSLSPTTVAPVSETAMLEDEELPTETATNTTHSTVGDEDGDGGTFPKPAKRKLPLDVEIPDSEDSKGDSLSEPEPKRVGRSGEVLRQA
ncbi:hypothetical protein ACHAP8_008226 [Fusarium lateritium]